MKRIKTPTIIQPRPRTVMLALFLLLLLLFLQGWQLFNYGRVQGGFDSEKVRRQTDLYLQQISAKGEELADVRSREARYKREAQVEQEAGRRLQQEIIQLNKENNELKNEVTLLRSLMSKNSSSFYIKRFEVFSTRTPNRYRYQVIVAQALDNVGKTKGKLKIGLIGKQEGKNKRVDLKQFSEDAVAAIALEFKYYQEVNGFINLEKGFLPEFVELEISPKKTKLGKMNKRFAWKVVETLAGGREGEDAGE